VYKIAQGSNLPAVTALPLPHHYRSHLQTWQAVSNLLPITLITLLA